MNTRDHRWGLRLRRSRSGTLCVRMTSGVAVMLFHAGASRLSDADIAVDLCWSEEEGRASTVN